MLILVLSLALVACGSEPADSEKEEAQPQENAEEETSTEAKEDTQMSVVDELTVYFVPSREPNEIITVTEPLKMLLTDELKKAGYEVKNINIEVGTTYEAVGEALEAGSADVGFIPGGTYVLYDEGAEVLLTATRAGLTKDSPEAKDWNDQMATEQTEDQVTYYRGLIVAGPSEKGQAILAKVNNGEEITKEDLEGLNWGHRSPTSSSGYIYPSIYLKDKYGVALNEMPNAIETDSYGSSMAKLAEESVDVITVYADARRDYVEKWQSEYNREKSIWEETGVIGVTDPIYNDTISVSKNSEVMTDEFKEALSNAFINIAGTDQGKEVIAIYSHEGYQKAQSSDYDKEREAQKVLRELTR